ncbi:MAG TPA: DUF5615 family PIN-like protein [Dehalococcoidia bacterium]|nr:DUF5615 family PIN-like protein [Dehalococcoidia bacterium]
MPRAGADRSAGVWHASPTAKLGRGKSVRYFLDEDVEIQTASVLRSPGIDVLTTREAGRLRASDESQMEFAGRSGRVLVTRNRDDFLEQTRSFLNAGRPHAGVLIVSNAFAQQDYGGIARAIARYDAEHRDGVPAYFFDFLSPGRHR